jgi:hypothetical protein
MSDPLHDVFEIHEPPPGGLGELRRRIQGERPPRRAWLGGLAVAAAATAAVLLLASPGEPEPGAELARHLACAEPALAGVLCGAGAVGATVAPGHQDRLALQAVPSSSERVLLYRVASSSPPLGVEQIPKVDLGRRPR